jgi:hypothetical protein
MRVIVYGIWCVVVVCSTQRLIPTFIGRNRKGRIYGFIDDES